MDSPAIREMALLEDGNWWYRARRELLAGILCGLGRKFAVALDVGCGTGANAAVLRLFAGRVLGVDRSADSLAFCERRGYDECLEGLAENLPTGDGSVELALCADVLEHVGDDVAVLREIRRALAPEGLLLLTVPAHRSLWNKNDDYCGHKRRYSKRELAQSLRTAGFRPVFLRWWNFSLILPFWIFARWERRRGPKAVSRNNLSAIPRWLDRFLLTLMRLENVFSRWLPLPGGASLVALAAPGEIDASQ
ncbi:class I SAM-dependent methyltransferase [Patescibacteria group bacterium]|nr:MAG: class I SAM-dependent methyltransferase [Patescibacteria group bacterium]